MRRRHWIFWPTVAVAVIGALLWVRDLTRKLEQQGHVLVGPDAKRDVCDYWKHLEANYVPKDMEGTCR